MPTNKLETKTIRAIPSNDKMPNNTITAISRLIKTNSINEFILVLENKEPIGHLDISDAY
jgi:1,2-phenylacetyl-CoA epoxidase catalytic subunit